MRAEIRAGVTRFGRLVVIGLTDRKGNGRGHEQSYWRCRCDCGNEKEILERSLRRGQSQSCGCLRKERATAATRTHGEWGRLTKTDECRAWNAMNARCYSVHTPHYPNYGGRGIRVCSRWRGKNGFSRFLADMGRKPTPDHTLDRLDNDKNYSPRNCRWATRKEQQNNLRRNRRLTHNGETLTITQWAERVGITQQGLGDRLKRGETLAQALSRPSKRPKREVNPN